MFTGIIEGLGTIREAALGEGLRLRIQADFPLEGVRLGDSIAVSGSCLTVVRLEGRFFSADVSPETCRRTTLGKARPGDRVNLERAMTLASRLDGHLVTGHVDGPGTVSGRREEKNAILYEFSAEENICRYLVEKGSVAVDGISLTINSQHSSGFSVSVIPHTAAITTIGSRRPGDFVNLETDIIGKYVERFVSRATGREPKGKMPGGIDMALLAQKGFL